MEGAYGAADPLAGEADSAAQSPASGAVVGGAPDFYRAGFAVGFGDAITSARSFPGAVCPIANATTEAASLPCPRPVSSTVVSDPVAASFPEAHPVDPSGVAGSFARGDGKKRTTATEGHGERKKLKGDPPVREKEHHIVVDSSAPCVAVEKVAGDIGEGEEGSEGEGEQVGAGDVEASEGEQVGAGDGEDIEDQQVGAGDVQDNEDQEESEDEEESEGASEDEEESEGDSEVEEESEGASEDEEESEGTSEDEEGSERSSEDEDASEGSCSDTATSSRKRRKDPMIEIMEGMLQTQQTI